eukprot:EG_transcript_31623
MSPHTDPQQRLLRPLAVEVHALAALQREHFRSLTTAIQPPDFQRTPAIIVAATHPVERPALPRHQPSFVPVRDQWHQRLPYVAPHSPPSHFGSDFDMPVPAAVSPPHTPPAAGARGWSPFDSPQWLSPPPSLPGGLSIAVLAADHLGCGPHASSQYICGRNNPPALSISHSHSLL